MTYRIDAADIAAPARRGQGTWWRSQLPQTLGPCTNDICRLDDGLALAYADYLPQQDLLEASTIDRGCRALTITVALEGVSSTVASDGQCFEFIAGHSTVAAFASARAVRRFPARRRTRQLRLIADESLLQRYRLEPLLDGVAHDDRARHLFFGQQDAATRQLAQALVHLHGRDASVLDLQIAALSLLAAQARTLQPLPQITPGRLRADDQQRLLQARDILLQQYDQALTIAHLCTATGINEFKLKQGFRELFGTSPHRMLTDIRMKKAWHLLESGLRVSTVADRVGYRHLSSFSAAFERHYGRRPKSVSRAC